jgi:hypothetical protein
MSVRPALRGNNVALGVATAFTSRATSLVAPMLSHAPVKHRKRTEAHRQLGRAKRG